MIILVKITISGQKLGKNAIFRQCSGVTLNDSIQNCYLCFPLCEIENEMVNFTYHNFNGQLGNIN